MINMMHVSDHLDEIASIDLRLAYLIQQAAMSPVHEELKARSQVAAFQSSAELLRQPHQLYRGTSKQRQLARAKVLSLCRLLDEETIHLVVSMIYHSYRESSPRVDLNTQVERAQRTGAVLDVLQPIPRQYVEEIEEPAARDMIAALRAESIELPEVGVIRSTFVGPADGASDAGSILRLPSSSNCCSCGELCMICLSLRNKCISCATAHTAHPKICSDLRNYA